VEDANAKHIGATFIDGCDHQWCVTYKGYYSAVGYMGQFIHVVPDSK